MSVQVNERIEPAPSNRGEPLIKAGLKYFPITQGILFQHHVAMCTRSTGSISRSIRAKRSGSSARQVAASPPSLVS